MWGLLVSVGGWLLKRIAVVLVGGAGAWAGWETGLLQPLIKTLFLMLFDLLLYVLDSSIGFLLWVMDEYNWDIPDAYSVLQYMPTFSMQVTEAVGLWNALGLLLSITIFKFFARIFTLRLLYK